MCTAPLEYAYVEEVEDLCRYRRGGYHPVKIEDRLGQQPYRIVHKLGYGTFSTTWLALDENKSKYVAIKVGTADADTTESATLSIITRAGNLASLLPVVLDQLDIHGPNGVHPCLVFTPARCSLRASKDASNSGLFQLPVARSLAAQLTLALAIVHSNGFVHGDLHLGNLILQLPSELDGLSVEELYMRYQRPMQEPVVPLRKPAGPPAAGVPLYVVPPLWLGVPSDELLLREARLMLTDFGLAFRPSEKPRFGSYTPIELRPPEAMFEPNTPLTSASDIWGLGCVIFELLAHRPLIDGFLASQDEITAQQVQLQGQLPKEWWDRWDNRSKWYDALGCPLSKIDEIWPWDRRFDEWVHEPRRYRGMESISVDERQALLEMLNRMLAFKPDERPNVQHILETRWMKQWALPAFSVFNESEKDHRS